MKKPLFHLTVFASKKHLRLRGGLLDQIWYPKQVLTFERRWSGDRAHEHKACAVEKILEIFLGQNSDLNKAVFVNFAGAALAAVIILGTQKHLNKPQTKPKVGKILERVTS